MARASWLQLISGLDKNACLHAGPSILQFNPRDSHMNKFLAALISAAFLAAPLALVTTPASAAKTTQAKAGQTSVKASAKSKSKSKASSKKKAKKQKSAATKTAP